MSAIAAIELPWPPRELSPNARPHWAQLAKAKKQYRLLCFVLARRAGVRGGMVTADKRLRVAMTFYPPVKRHRDKDNLLASMKAALDGLADALLVDDRQFDPVVTIADCRKGGVVKVELYD